jgi:Chain length determinant protein.
MELRRQIAVLRGSFWLLVASILLAGGAAYLVSSTLPKVYEAKVTLIVGQSTQAANPDLNQLP